MEHPLPFPFTRSHAFDDAGGESGPGGRTEWLPPWPGTVDNQHEAFLPNPTSAASRVGPPISSYSARRDPSEREGGYLAEVWPEGPGDLLSDGHTVACGSPLSGTFTAKGVNT